MDSRGRKIVVCDNGTGVSILFLQIIFNIFTAVNSLMAACESYASLWLNKLGSESGNVSSHQNIVFFPKV